MDEISDEEEGGASSGLAGASSALGASAHGIGAVDTLPNEVRDMSVSTLHLYDLHEQVGQVLF